MDTEDRVEDSTLSSKDISVHQKPTFAEIVNVNWSYHRFSLLHIQHNGKTWSLASVLIHRWIIGCSPA